MYTIGFLAWCGLLGIALGAGIVALLVSAVTRQAVVAVGAVVALILWVPFAWVTTFPHEKAYHAWVEHEGTVLAVDSRLISAGDKGGSDTKYVVLLDEGDGTPQEYGCTDTRCSLIDEGDTLSLKCIKQWDFQGTDGYDCKWGSRTPAATPTA